MPRRFLGMALAAVVGIGAAQAEPTLDRVRVEAFVDGAVREAMRAEHIAGVSVAIVDRSGVVLARGYGVAAFRRRKADADTLFRVGSISKTPVWIALMQLVEQGKLSLDDPINDHLPPALRIPDEGFKKPILVRHLMTHTAGFEDSDRGLVRARPGELAAARRHLASHRVHRVREPGTLAVYSNYGAALAGALVAHVAGEPWQDYAEKHILRPLGMASGDLSRALSRRARDGARLARANAAGRRGQGDERLCLATGEFHTQPFEYVSD